MERRGVCAQAAARRALIQQPTDAIIRVTTSGICGSDLHLYEVLGPFMNAGDILGHEPMGVVEEVGSEVNAINVKRWVPDIMPLLTDDDPLGVDSLATHRVPLSEGPAAYEAFQKKQDGAVKILPTPWTGMCSHLL